MAETLTQAQIDAYHRDGFTVLEAHLNQEILQALRAEIARFETMAQDMSQSDDRIDLEDSHSPENPRIRRVKLPHTQSQVVRDLMVSDAILGPARDLIGPDIRLHNTKLNMKSAGYGAAVEWHQDYAFYPHTNDDLLAIGVIIDDMDLDNGPLMVFPGSHKGPVYDHHANGVFAGAFVPQDEGLDMADAVPLMGPAGSISIHHGRIVHGSALNTSSKSRRILFIEMMAADAFPIMGSMTKFETLAEYDAKMLCGQPTLTPRLEPIPIRIPLPQPEKAGSIYEVQSHMSQRAFATHKEDNQ